MKFFENVKRRKRIIASSFFENKNRLVELIFKMIFYACLSYNFFIISVGLTYDLIGKPIRWLIITASTVVPIIIVIFEIAFGIKHHLNFFDLNPFIVLTSDMFIYQFYRVRKTGEVIEVKYKTKPYLIENIYVDENKKTMFIKAPFDIANDEDVVMARDDALFIPLVFHEKDKLLYFIERVTNKRIELLK